MKLYQAADNNYIWVKKSEDQLFNLFLKEDNQNQTPLFGHQCLLFQLSDLMENECWKNITEIAFCFIFKWSMLDTIDKQFRSIDTIKKKLEEFFTKNNIQGKILVPNESLIVFQNFSCSAIIEEEVFINEMSKFIMWMNPCHPFLKVKRHTKEKGAEAFTWEGIDMLKKQLDTIEKFIANYENLSKDQIFNLLNKQSSELKQLLVSSKERFSHVDNFLVNNAEIMRNLHAKELNNLQQSQNFILNFYKEIAKDLANMINSIDLIENVQQLIICEQCGLILSARFHGFTSETNFSEYKMANLNNENIKNLSQIYEDLSACTQEQELPKKTSVQKPKAQDSFQTFLNAEANTYASKNGNEEFKNYDKTQKEGKDDYLQRLRDKKKPPDPKLTSTQNKQSQNTEKPKPKPPSSKMGENYLDGDNIPSYLKNNYHHNNLNNIKEFLETKKKFHPSNQNVAEENPQNNSKKPSNPQNNISGARQPASRGRSEDKKVNGNKDKVFNADNEGGIPHSQPTNSFSNNNRGTSQNPKPPTEHQHNAGNQNQPPFSKNNKFAHINEDKVKIEKMLYEQSRRKTNEETVRKAERVVDPVIQDTINKIILAKPWLNQSYLSMFNLAQLKANFTFQENELENKSPDKTHIEKELNMIKESVLVIKDKSRESKTDHELLLDVRYLSKNKDYAILRLSQKNHYGRLGLSTSATDSEVKNAYKARVLMYHPDNMRKNLLLFSNCSMFEEFLKEMFQLIDESYKTLINKEKRRNYDLTLKIPVRTYN